MAEVFQIHGVEGDLLRQLHTTEKALTKLARDAGAFAGMVSWVLEALSKTDLDERQAQAFEVLVDALSDFQTALNEEAK